MTEFEDEVEFKFDEIIAEQNLENFVTVSPRHDELRVSWKRSTMTVRPRDGWLPNVVYTVTLLPGVTDLRNNRSDSSRAVVFSTGGPIPDTRVTGSVVNWEEGRIAGSALIEAISLPDSITYLGSADSVGDFELPFLRHGTYHLRAAIDANNNQRLDSREAYDSATVTLADAILVHDFWTFRHDTVGPRITTVSLVDSQAVSVGFDQMLDLTPLFAHSFRILELPDSTRIAVDRVMRRTEFDSLQAERREAARAVADSAARAERDSILAADSTAVLPTDTLVAADSVAALVPATPDTALVEEVPDTTRAMRMLQERPQLYSQVVVLLVAPLRPGTRYWVEGTPSNLLQAWLVSGRFLVLPEAVEPDST